MLMETLAPLRRKTTPPAVECRSMPRVRPADVTWVEPKLVCEVEFPEWTREGRLRAPSYKGLRDDKPASEVHREHPAEGSSRSGRSSSPTSTRCSGRTRASRRAT